MVFLGVSLPTLSLNALKPRPHVGLGHSLCVPNPSAFVRPDAKSGDPEAKGSKRRQRDALGFRAEGPWRILCFEKVVPQIPIA